MHGVEPQERFGDALACSKTSPATSGHSLIAIGAPGKEQGRGRVVLYDADNTSAALQEISSPQPGQEFHFGEALSFVTDVNGDNIDELVVGEPKASPQPGSIHIFHSSIENNVVHFTHCQSFEGDESFGKQMLGLRGPYGIPGHSDRIVVSAPKSGSTYGFELPSSCAAPLMPSPRFTSINNSGQFGAALAEVPDSVMGSGDNSSDIIVGQPDFIIGAMGKVHHLGSDLAASSFSVLAEDSYGRSIAASYQSNFIALGSPSRDGGRGGIDIHNGSTGVVCTASVEAGQDSLGFGSSVAHLDTSFSSLFGGAPLASFATTRSEIETGGTVALFGFDGAGCNSFFPVNNCEFDPTQEQGKVIVGGSDCTIHRDGTARAMLVFSSPGWSGEKGRVDVITDGSMHGSALSCSASPMPTAMPDPTGTPTGAPTTSPTIELTIAPTEIPTGIATDTETPVASIPPTAAPSATATATAPPQESASPEVPPGPTAIPSATAGTSNDLLPTPVTETPTWQPTPTVVPVAGGGTVEPGQGDLAAPTVEIVGSTAFVTMPQLTPAVTGANYQKALKRLMKKGLTQEEAKRSLRRLRLTYIITVTRTVGVRTASFAEQQASVVQSSIVLRSRNNRIAVRNLSPGNYVTSGTVEISTIKPTLVLGSSKASQSTSFTVPAKK